MTPSSDTLELRLQGGVRDAALGRRLADKLVSVYRTDGGEAWVLIHVEVQGPPEPAFAEGQHRREVLAGPGRKAPATASRPTPRDRPIAPSQRPQTRHLPLCP